MQPTWLWPLVGLARYRLTRSIGVTVCLLAWTITAHAERTPQPLDLSFDGSKANPSCPNESVIRALVERRAGGQAFAPTAPRRLTVSVVSAGHRHQARLILSGSDGKPIGTRTIVDSTPDCRELAPALALIIGLLLEGQTSLEPTPPYASNPSPKKPSSSEAPAERAPATSPPRKAKPLAQDDGGRGWVGLGGGLAVRALPEPTELFTLQAGGTLWRSLELELGGARLVSKDATLGRIRVGVSATEVWLAPVLAFKVTSWLAFRTELGFFQGMLDCQVTDTLPVDTGSLAYFGLRFGNSLDFSLVENLGLRLGAKAQTPLMRQRLRVVGLEEPLFTQPWVGGRAEILAVWRFR